jgi:glyoxylase-like metal-dependent hydrolase (beta-lactamase superfamily II)
MKGAGSLARMTADWTNPGTFEAAPGVFRIPLPLPNDGLRAVNVYAIADRDRVVMIDSGWAFQASQDLLARSLGAIGYGLADISDFLVTHVHRDHYTQAVAIRRSYGSRVSLGEGERATLEAIRSPAAESSPLGLLLRAGAKDLYRLMSPTLRPDPDEIRNSEMPDIWLHAQKIDVGSRSLSVIATPGHTQGHVVFMETEGQLLFAGDHVLPHITPSIGLELVTGRLPLQDYLLSLALMKSIPDARLLPAHGPATSSVHERVDELLEHHQRRLDATKAAITAGASTAFEVASRLTWTRHNRSLIDLDPFNQTLAVVETAAHLDVLVERLHLWATSVDGVRHYSTRESP